MPGPVPKRTEERRRQNKEGHGLISRAQSFSALPVDPPPADSTWHPTATYFYEALAQSGQAQFYEASDWAVAFYVTTMMSASLDYKDRPSAHLVVAVLQAAGELMATEGARRRLRLELTRNQDEKPSHGVTALAEYRKALGG